MSANNLISQQQDVPSVLEYYKNHSNEQLSTQIKRYQSTAATHLDKANRCYAYAKNGQGGYYYAEAKKYYRMAAENSAKAQELGEILEERIHGSAVRAFTGTPAVEGHTLKGTDFIANKTLWQNISAEQVLSGATSVGALGGAISGAVALISCLLDDEIDSVDDVLETTTKSAAVGYASGAAGFVGGEIASMMVGGATGILPGAAVVAGAALTADIVDTVAKPTIEGIGDAILCGAPALALYGLQEGVGDAVENILEGVGSIFDGISDFFDEFLSF